ncbi:T9SS type A sorting domain-containing protein [bacterium SCSIO 12741]|nr:T9SS type A sorting domain-containing protein [bacterium SCSIO 12741]
MDFDPGPDTTYYQSEGSSDLFISKFDPNGKLLWTKTLGSFGIDEGEDVEVDSHGNVFLTGKTWGIVDMDPGPGNFYRGDSGIYQSFVLKLDNQGQFLWSSVLANGLQSYGNEIALGSNGEVFSIGYMVGTIDFDPDTGQHILTSGVKGCTFVQGLNNNGDLLWASTLDFDGNIRARDLAIDPIGQLYLSGVFLGSVDFDPGPGQKRVTGVHNTFQGFMLKLTPSGHFTWVKVLESNGDNIITDIQLTPSNRLLISANSGTPLDMDPNGSIHQINIQGSLRSSAIAVYSQNACQPSAGVDQQTSCRTFTWIDGQTYTSDDSTATYTLTNKSGCDSVVTLDLTIQKVDTQITRVGDTLHALAQGLAYFQWLDCDSNYKAIPGASHSKFAPSKPGQYAVAINQNWCFDTTSCSTYFPSDNGTNVDELRTERPVFNAYPNPCSKFIQLSSTHPGTLTIHNLNGEKVQDYYIQKEARKIDVAHLKQGVYLLIFESEAGQMDHRSLVKY